MLVGALNIVKPREASFPSLSGTAADVLLPDSDHWWLLAGLFKTSWQPCIPKTPCMTHDHCALDTVDESGLVCGGLARLQ